MSGANHKADDAHYLPPELRGRGTYVGALLPDAQPFIAAPLVVIHGKAEGFVVTAGLMEAPRPEGPWRTTYAWRAYPLSRGEPLTQLMTRSNAACRRLFLQVEPDPHAKPGVAGAGVLCTMMLPDLASMLQGLDLGTDHKQVLEALEASFKNALRGGSGALADPPAETLPSEPNVRSDAASAPSDASTSNVNRIAALESRSGKALPPGAGRAAPPNYRPQRARRPSKAYRESRDKKAVALACDELRAYASAFDGIAKVMRRLQRMTLNETPDAGELLRALDLFDRATARIVQLLYRVREAQRRIAAEWEGRA
jgi:hypothetical protein